MRDLKRGTRISLCLIFSLGFTCKTQRPVVEIEEQITNEGTTLKAPPEAGEGKATLKISALSMPVDPESYTRISVLLKTKGMTDISIANYALKSEIPIRSNRKYGLTVVTFQSGQPIYSSEYCHISNHFTSRTGTNNYTVPVCPQPVNAGGTPTEIKDEGEGTEDVQQLLETPSAPGS